MLAVFGLGEADRVVFSLAHAQVVLEQGVLVEFSRICLVFLAAVALAGAVPVAVAPAGEGPVVIARVASAPVVASLVRALAVTALAACQAL